MKRATGHLELISLEEILEGVEKRRKTGVLKIARGEVRKIFYLQEGKVIFVTSNGRGERFGEFLAATGCLDLERMNALVEESRRREVPFTGDLMALGILDQKKLESALCQLAVCALAEALTWNTGTFDFNDLLPSAILKGPVQIEVPGALGRAVRLNRVREERRRATGPEPSPQPIS